MPSFATPAQLATHLHSSVDTGSAQQALDSATGLLRNATRPTLDVDPTPIPDVLRAWTLELAAMIYENPANRASEEAGDISTGWSDRRRAEILMEASRRYGGPGSGPTFYFPEPAPWPFW